MSPQETLGPLPKGPHSPKRSATADKKAALSASLVNQFRRRSMDRLQTTAVALGATRGCLPGGLFAAPLHIDVQPLDLLIQCRERHPLPPGRFGLAPVETIQLFDDGAPLEISHNLKQRSIRRQRAVFRAPQ